LVLGVVLQAAVIFTPLTPYPLAQMWLDREGYEMQRGYNLLLEKGILRPGDPAFEFIRDEYMEDVARGLRTVFTEDELLGLSIVAFQLGEPESPEQVREAWPVYVVFSNNRAQILPGDVLKLRHVRRHAPYADTFNLALLAAGCVAVYQGLKGLLLGGAVSRGDLGGVPEQGNALAPSARS
jgi:hypothetical protein